MRIVSFAGIASLMFLISSVCASQSVPKPLLLERNEGELKTRRPGPKPSPATQFMLKVDPKTNGSQHLIVGTEDIAPGASIPTHKHPTEDEVLLIHSGEAHVLLGEQERDLHAGGLVFIPANTWIGLKNISAEPLARLTKENTYFQAARTWFSTRRPKSEYI